VCSSFCFRFRFLCAGFPSGSGVCAPALVSVLWVWGLWVVGTPDSPVLVGFEGSRSLSASFAPVVSSLVSSVLASGRFVATGCAGGLDALVRSACPSCRVFSASPFGRGRGAYAARTVALVRAVAASGSGCGLVVFPGRGCPAGLGPSASSSRCFCGLGSGSWAAAALAVGLGVPVVVFGVSPADLPSSWGSWVPAAASGVWASGFRLVPAAPVQGSLF
jgi:hypothetical protein